MPIETCQSLVGRLLEDPVLESTRTGRNRFVARVLREPRLRASAIPSEPEMATQVLIATDAIAQRAFDQFTEGDHVIAVGTVRLEVSGSAASCRPVLLFEASYIGHDLIRTRYAVDRTRRGHHAATLTPARRDAIERELDLAETRLAT